MIRLRVAAPCSKTKAFYCALVRGRIEGIAMGFGYPVKSFVRDNNVCQRSLRRHVALPRRHAQTNRSYEFRHGCFSASYSRVPTVSRQIAEAPVLPRKHTKV